MELRGRSDQDEGECGKAEPSRWELQLLQEGV